MNLLKKFNTWRKRTAHAYIFNMLSSGDDHICPEWFDSKFKKYPGLVNTRGDNGYTPLHFAVDLDRDDLFESFLQAGAKVNMKDCAGNTPMHLAADAGLWYYVHDLLARDGDPAQMNKDDLCPFDLALEIGRRETIELMLPKMPTDLLVKALQKGFMQDIIQAKIDSRGNNIDGIAQNGTTRDLQTRRIVLKNMIPK